MKRRPLGLHYCSSCKATTRHAEADTTSTCMRCGTVKQVTRVVKSPASTQREEEALWN